MKEFKINEYLTVKLEDDKSFIYIKDMKFKQCMRLVLSMPKEDLSEYKQIDSIDEAAEVNETLFRNRVMETNQPHSITPEQEFWGHASNLQAWAENNYDTRIIHSNLAFPLLKKLVDAGDTVAIRVFSEEIVRRFESGYAPVIEYLLKEGYFSFLTREASHYIREEILSQRDAEILKTLEKDLGLHLKILKDQYWEEEILDGFLVRNKKVSGLCLGSQRISCVSDAVNKLKIIEEFESLEELHVRFYLKGFHESLGNLKNLKILDLRWNKLSALPNSILTLKSLTTLDLDHNPLTTLPEAIGDLKSLKELNLYEDKLTTLPESIGDLKSLKILTIVESQLSTLPKSIGNLRSLKRLELLSNPFKTIPKSIGNLRSLTYLHLGGNELLTIPKSIGNLRSLTYLNLGGNELSIIPKSIGNLKSLTTLYVSINPLNSRSKFRSKRLKKKCKKRAHKSTQVH